MCHLASVMLPITFVAYHRIFLFLSFIIYTQVFYLPDPRALLFPLEPPRPNSSPHPKAQVLQGTPEKNESYVKGMPGLFVQL